VFVINLNKHERLFKFIKRFMFSTIFLLLLISFYLLYNLSARVKAANSTVYLSYLRKHRLLSRVVSFALILVSGLLLIRQLGLGAGVFGLIVILMSTGSLIVALTPLRYLRLPHVLACYLLCIVFEVLIF